MILPDNYKELSDEELLKKLIEIYEDPDAANYALKVVRGKVKPPYPLP